MSKRTLAMYLALAGGLAAAAWPHQAREAVVTPEGVRLPVSQSAYLERAKTEKIAWYTSGQAAFAKARERNVPVLLDGGATWCPWSELMERESYRDPQLADYMNAHFVALKIDFDADPKLSAELERVQAVMNLPAGLPLTAFVTPDGKLYSGGGFFPKEAKGGKPAFRNALAEALKMYEENRSEVERDGVKLKIGE